MSVGAEVMEIYFGLPKETLRECTAFLDHYRNWQEAALTVANLKIFLETKTMAIQQAGVIRLLPDIELAYSAVEELMVDPDGLH